MAVLWPDGIGRKNDFILWDNLVNYPETYRANIVLDSNADGTVTKDEATKEVINEAEKNNEIYDYLKDPRS